MDEGKRNIRCNCKTQLWLILVVLSIICVFDGVMLIIKMNPLTVSTLTGIIEPQINDKEPLRLKIDYNESLLIDNTILNKYFDELHHRTKLSLSPIPNYVQLLNVYEINIDKSIINGRDNMWLSSIYDKSNDIYWTITRTVFNQILIISVYKYSNNTFIKIIKDRVYNNSQGIKLEEPRLYHLNKHTILATNHDTKGGIVTFNFTKFVVEPTKRNKFRYINFDYSNEHNTFYFCNIANRDYHKNWSPIIIDKTLHFVIQHEPFTIIKCPNMCKHESCKIIYIETLPKEYHDLWDSQLRGGTQYISLDHIFKGIYISFLHSHIETEIAPHKAIYRGHLCVINVTSFKILYISQPISWKINTKDYEIKWAEASPAGIIKWDIDRNNDEDIMFISWAIGGQYNFVNYWGIITKQCGFFKFIKHGVKCGFDSLYIKHPYWEKRIARDFLDFWNVRNYNHSPTGKMVHK